MSTDQYENSPDLSVVADLARRSATIAPPARDGDDNSLVLVRRRSDEQVDTIDLERFEAVPRRGSGAVTAHDPGDFATYVQRVGTAYTTVWADQNTNKVTAVLNDHEPGAEPGREGERGWRDDTVVLDVLGDPEWQAWEGKSGQLIPPVKFAEHLEEYGPNVTDPNPAEMLTIAQSIRATRTARIEDTRDLQTGAIRFSYVETIDARAGERDQIEIPAEFGLSIAPYLGYDPVPLRARLRFRVGEKGGLEIGYQLIRPDLIKRAAFAAVRQTIAERLGEQYPVLLGVPPASRGRSGL